MGLFENLHTNRFEFLYKLLYHGFDSHTVETKICICVDDTWFLVTVRQDCRLILSEIDHTEVSICEDDT